MPQAVRFYEAGGPEVLRFEDVEVGAPGAGQARVRHHAVGLNFADTYFRTGLYPAPLPAGMGVEAEKAHDADELCRAFERGLSVKGPYLVEVVM